MFYGVLFIIHLRKVRKKLKFITGSFIQLLPIKISLKDDMINKGDSHCYYFSIRYDQHAIRFRGVRDPFPHIRIGELCMRTHAQIRPPAYIVI